MVVAIDLETDPSSDAVFLTTILILVLVILEDWFPSFSAEFYGTLSYLFDAIDEIIVHPMHHVVGLKAGPGPTHSPGYSVIDLGPCKPCAHCWM